MTATIAAEFSGAPVPDGATNLPRQTLDAAPATPRAGLGAVPAQDRFIVWGSRFAAVGLAWVITQRVMPWHGIPWFLVVAAVCNVVVLAVATFVVDNGVAVSDRVAQWFVSAAATVVFGALLSTIVYVVVKGWPALHHTNFWTTTMEGVGAQDPLTHGGIVHAVVGTLIELAIAVVISLPLGVGTAVFMTEIGGRFGRVVRTVVEAMTALPDILAGLFIYTVWILALGEPRSGLAAGLALAVMMLPIIARTSDVVLRVVPNGLREASYGLGSSRWRTVWYVVLPTARSGLATALILGVARGIGETAPVLITSGNANFMVTNPIHGGVMSSLPLFIFTSARSGIPVQIQRGFGTAVVLLLLVVILFVTARLIARPPSSKPSLWRRLRHLPGRMSFSTGLRADPLVPMGPISPEPPRVTDNAMHYPPAPNEDIP